MPLYDKRSLIEYDVEMFRLFRTDPAEIGQFITQFLDVGDAIVIDGRRQPLRLIEEFASDDGVEQQYTCLSREGSKEQIYCLTVKKGTKQTAYFETSHSSRGITSIALISPVSYPYGTRLSERDLIGRLGEDVYDVDLQLHNTEGQNRELSSKFDHIALYEHQNGTHIESLQTKIDIHPLRTPPGTVNIKCTADGQHSASSAINNGTITTHLIPIEFIASVSINKQLPRRLNLGVPANQIHHQTPITQIQPYITPAHSAKRQPLPASIARDRENADPDETIDPVPYAPSDLEGDSYVCDVCQNQINLTSWDILPYMCPYCLSGRWCDDASSVSLRTQLKQSDSASVEKYEHVL